MGGCVSSQEFNLRQIDCNEFSSLSRAFSGGETVINLALIQAKKLLDGTLEHTDLIRTFLAFKTNEKILREKLGNFK